MIGRRALLVGGLSAAVVGVAGTLVFRARGVPPSGDKPAAGFPASAGTSAPGPGKPTVTVHRPPT